MLALLAFSSLPAVGQRYTTNAAALGVSLVQGFPGVLSQVPISLRNTGSVVAAQFELSYSPTHLAPGSLSQATLAGNGTVKWREISPGLLRYIVYSPQNARLATNAQIGSLPVGVPTGELTGGRIFPSNFLAAAFDGSLIQPAFASIGGVLVAPLFHADDGTMYLMFSAQSNQTYIVQATTNFLNWVNISTNTAVENYFIVADPDAANLRYRFYRLLTVGGVPAWTISGINYLLNGSINFQISGSASANFVVQASTNLSIWSNIATNTAGPSPVPFTDPDAALYRTRFYRISVSP